MATLVQGPLHRDRPAPRRGRAVGATIGTVALILMTGMVATPAGASTPTISGKITGAGGVGIAGATVDFLIVGSTFGIGPETTAADGSYSFAPGPGSYQIEVDTPPSGDYLDGFYSATSATGYTPALADASVVVLGTTSVTGINVQLPLVPPPTPTPTPVTGPSISGTIRMAGGNSVAGAIVNACDVSASTPGGCPTSITNALGKYAIPVAPGTYDLEVYAQNFPFGFYDSSAPGKFTEDQNSATAIVVHSVPVSGIDVQFPSVGSISGSVLNAGGHPIPNIGVSACPVAGGSCGSGSTDSTGKYDSTGEILGVAYTVCFFDPTGTTMAGCYDAAASGHFSPSSSSPITLSTSHPDVTGIEVQVPDARFITGVVRDSSGTPDSGDFVEFLPAVGPGGNLCMQTTSSGAYRCPVTPGSYSFAVEVDNPDGSLTICYYRAGTTCTTDRNRATIVTVTNADVSGIDIILPAAASPSPTPTAKPTARPTTKPTAKPTTKPRGTLPSTSLGTRSGPADTPPTLPLAIVFLLGAALTLTILSYRHRPLR